MCRARPTTLSMKTTGSPKADLASALADRRAGSNSVGASTSRMPRPPPPAVALMSSGKPIWSASAIASSPSCTGPPHGTTGIPAASASALASIFEPSRRIVSAEGPMNRIELSSQSCANSSLSETNPHPTQTVSILSTSRRVSNRSRLT